MSESEAEARPKEEPVIVTCEGCSSRWRLRFQPLKEIVADLVECPLCTGAEKHE